MGGRKTERAGRGTKKGGGAVTHLSEGKKRQQLAGSGTVWAYPKKDGGRFYQSRKGKDSTVRIERERGREQPP